MDNQSQPSRARLLMLVLVGSTFMASLDLFVVNVAVDDIGRSFSGSSLGDVSWIINAYAIVYAALLIPAGRWADRVGRKRGFLTGIALFTLASVACALSPSLWFLVVARCLQAAGAAIMTPASLGLLIVSVPADKRASAIRLWTTASALASAAGPVVGGLLVQVSWQWVFVINLPVGVALFLGGQRVITEFRTADGEPVDVLGAAALAVGVGAVAVAIVQGPDWGWTSAGVLAAAGVAVLAAGAFAIRTRLAAHPIIDPTLLRIPSFRAANLAMIVFSVTFAAGLLSVILFLQTVWGFGALESGLAVAPGPFVVPFFAILGARLAAKASAKTVAALGCLLWAGGLALIALTVGDRSAYVTEVLPGWVISGAGVGLALPMIMGVATAALPSARSATGGAIVNVSRQIGTVLGVSLVVAVLDMATDDATSPHGAFLPVLWSGVVVGLVGLVVCLAMTRSRAQVAPQPAEVGARP